MTLARTRRRRSAVGGEMTDFDYEGPWSVAVTYYEDNRSNTDYDEVSLSPTGPGKGMVTISLADELNAADVETWELRELEVMKDIGEHPYFGASGSMPDAIAKVEAGLKKGLTFDEIDLPGFETEMEAYYGLRTRGVDKYISSGVELTRTLTTSRRSIVDLHLDLVNTVVSLDSDINPPLEIDQALQELRKLDEGANLPYGDDDFSAASWEWLMRMPTVRVGAKGRREITFRWWGMEKWSQILYPGGTWAPST